MGASEIYEVLEQSHQHIQASKMLASVETRQPAPARTSDVCPCETGQMNCAPRRLPIITNALQCAPSVPTSEQDSFRSARSKVAGAAWMALSSCSFERRIALKRWHRLYVSTAI